MYKTNCLVFVLTLFLISCGNLASQKEDGWKSIRVSDNNRFFQYEDGTPFFWLGDTGWLLFKKLDREEAEMYLEDRSQKGFNVIQVMVLHDVNVTNFQGDEALADKNVARPVVTEGNDPTDPVQYDYWDHVEYVVDLAAEKGLYMALVPVWGTPVNAGFVTVDEAKEYGKFLVERFGDKPNIIWLNGGDTMGDQYTDVWLALGNTLDSLDEDHLITFHPRGRKMSSEWFHDESWLDFNMFQSGHRNYEQDTASDSHRFGPDNWKYVQEEYNKKPVKPTLDAEPSYEGIPHGLHDSTQAYWNDADVRRYGYWSVFAGGAGYTYGHNSVMQFYAPEDQDKAFGAKVYWQEAINSPGAEQMVHLKNLMLDNAYFDRVPDQELIADQGERYDFQVGTKGEKYAMIYTFTGRAVSVEMGRIKGERVTAIWYNPRNGETTEIGQFANTGSKTFDPPGNTADGNDWVLVLKTR